MKKLLGVFILIMVMTIPAISSASLFNDLRNDPNYIYLGHIGTGTGLFLDKTSINVHEYNPPYYTIACVNLWWAYPDPRKDELLKTRVHRYRYDYAKKEIYFEKHDINNNPYWDELNPKEFLKMESSQAFLVEPELVFYLAYNISFYDKPLSPKAKAYINSAEKSVY